MSICGRKFILLVLSLALLSYISMLYGVTKATAAESRIGNRVEQIAAGTDHVLALRDDRSIIAWGINYSNQTDVPSDVQSHVVSVAAGGFHSLALKDNGSVVAWGDDSYDLLNVPNEAKSDVVAIAAGFSHSLALKADGSVIAWGDNSYSQTNVPLEAQSNVSAIAAGGNQSLALMDDGSVVAWGAGSHLLPDLTGTSITAIAAGFTHSLALTDGGSVIAWGDNSNGQTIVPSEAQSGVSAIAAGWGFSLALKDGSVIAWGSNSLGETNVPLEAQSDVVAIAAGDTYALALRDDGSIVTWGNELSQSRNVPGSNTLSQLVIDEGSLNVPFTSSTTSYTAYISPQTANVHIKATVTDATYTDLYIQNQWQPNGSTVTVGITEPITVQVEPNLKAVQTYTITVVKDATPPNVHYNVNGLVTSANTAATQVTITDTESGIDPSSLQYTWTQSVSMPTDGWTGFANGDSLGVNSVSGSWYLHVRASDFAGNATDAVSNEFVLGSNSPSSHEPSEPTDQPYIDLNGTKFDPAEIDATKNTFTLNVTPKGNSADITIPSVVLSELESQNDQLNIEIKAPFGSYIVPVNLASAITGLDEMLSANHVTVNDVSFKITIKDRFGDISPEYRDLFEDPFKKADPFMMAVEFNLEIVNNATNQTIGTAHHFSQAMMRMFTLPMEFQVEQLAELAGYRLNESTNGVEFVPTRIVEIDGVKYLLISSYSNSVYVVVNNPVTYSDIRNHWGKSYIELAGSKGLVKGVGAGKYDPNKAVTRAEFTAMLVRALSRGTFNSQEDPYKDVLPDAWYYNEVAQAKELGLLDFVIGDNFEPEKPLLREEMASMLARVISLEKLPAPKELARIDNYKDFSQMDVLKRDDIRLIVTNRLMTGIAANRFSPKGETTRAQAAVVLIQTLRVLNWID